jgi:hypothetical protein
MSGWQRQVNTSVFTKWIQILLMIGYRFGLMQITQVSKNFISDTSDNVCDGLNHVTEKIIEESITTTDPDIIGISLVLDAKDEENSERICNIDHEVPSPYRLHSAVLPKPSLINANINSAITAMLDIVQPKNDDEDEDATYDEVFPHEKICPKPTNYSSVA